MSVYHLILYPTFASLEKILQTRSIISLWYFFAVILSFHPSRWVLLPIGLPYILRGIQVGARHPPDIFMAVQVDALHPPDNLRNLPDCAIWGDRDNIRFPIFFLYFFIQIDTN